MAFGFSKLGVRMIKSTTTSNRLAFPKSKSGFHHSMVYDRLESNVLAVIEQLGHFTEENCVRISTSNRMHKVKQENQNEGYYGLFREQLNIWHDQNCKRRWIKGQPKDDQTGIRFSRKADQGLFGHSMTRLCGLRSIKCQVLNLVLWDLYCRILWLFEGLMLTKRSLFQFWGHFGHFDRPGICMQQWSRHLNRGQKWNFHFDLRWGQLCDKNSQLGYFGPFRENHYLRRLQWFRMVQKCHKFWEKGINWNYKQIFWFGPKLIICSYTGSSSIKLYGGTILAKVFVSKGTTGSCFLGSNGGFLVITGLSGLELSKELASGGGSGNNGFNFSNGSRLLPGPFFLETKLLHIFEKS
ncbi:hypothetical protein LXL04_036276 [Taraxacum kok-saghyz]